MPGPLRLGLAGAGRWGRNYIRTIAELRDLRLARVASSNPETPTLVPAGCRVVRDWRELIDPAAVDGIIVATPPASHAEIASAAIEEGIPVLIEKPLALSSAEARAIRNLAKERRVHALVEHTHLFSPAFRALKQLTGHYGGVREIQSQASNHGPFRPDISVLWDWGPHDVAMCLDLLQTSPVSAACTMHASALRDGGRAETIGIALSFPSGVLASILLSNTNDKARRFSVRCDEATLVYDDMAVQKLIVSSNDGKQSSAVDVAGDLPLSVAVREFASGIASRSHDLASVELGLRVVQVLETCA